MALIMRSPACILIVLVLAATPASAGVYGRLEKLPPVASSHRDMRLLLGELRDAGTHDDTRPVVAGSLRSEYLSLREKLSSTPADGPSNDLMDLAVCHLRLGQPEKARGILEALQTRVEATDPLRFQVLGNLASAYQELAARGLGRDFLERAYLVQSQMLKAWPENATKAPKGWTFPVWRFLLQAERAQWKLLRGRLLESTNPPPRFDPNQAGPDIVFEGPVYSPSAEAYRPGPSDRTIWEALPDEAVDLTRQLVAWMPLDNRTFWLLGETLNAAGETAEGLRILEELANARQMRHVRTLGQHIEILKSSQAATAPTGPEAADSPHAPPSTPEVTVDLGSFWRIFSVGLATGAIISLLARWQLGAILRRGRGTAR